jgi:hypothetical protein
VADAGNETERADHGGEAEQQRDAGGDECAEGDQEDEQRGRQRERQRLGGVLGVLLGECLVHACAAELADENVRVGVLDLVDRGDRRLDELVGLGLVALEVELHEHGAPVLGDLAVVALLIGGLDVRHAGLARHRGDGLSDGRTNGCVGRLAALGRLDDDLL